VVSADIALLIMFSYLLISVIRGPVNCSLGVLIHFGPNLFRNSVSPLCSSASRRFDSFKISRFRSSESEIKRLNII
jgi:hypothetical protein